MVQKVIWSDDALSTFANELQYLEVNFSQVEIQKFVDKTSRKLLIIKSNPRLGSKVNRRPNTYKTVVNKRIVLYYHYKPRKEEIFLLRFWNTLQNPKKLKI